MLGTLTLVALWCIVAVCGYEFDPAAPDAGYSYRFDPRAPRLEDRAAIADLLAKC